MCFWICLFLTDDSYLVSSRQIRSNYMTIQIPTYVQLFFGISRWFDMILHTNRAIESQVIILLTKNYDLELDHSTLTIPWHTFNIEPFLTNLNFKLFHIYQSQILGTKAKIFTEVWIEFSPKINLPPKQWFE